MYTARCKTCHSAWVVRHSNREIRVRQRIDVDDDGALVFTDDDGYLFEEALSARYWCERCSQETDIVITREAE